MRIAAIIPARLGSTRLPGKPLAMLGGKPLVVRTALQAQKCKEIDNVVIATDAPQIVEAAKRHHVEAKLTRSDHASGTDRVAEVAHGLNCEAVINLQGDEPFVDPQDLSAMARALRTQVSDMITLRSSIDNPADLTNPNVVKVVTREDGLAMYFSRAPIPFERAGHGDLAHVYRHIGVYGYQRHTLEQLCKYPVHALEKRERLEQLRALVHGLTILVLDAKTVAQGIDTPEDLAQAQTRVEALGETAFP